MNNKIIGGILGSIVGGIVMGLAIMMIMQPVMLAISKLWGFNSIGAGWLVHLINSAVIGIIFAFIFDEKVKNMSSGIIWGLVYGFIWWILGPLLIMPLWLKGQTAFQAALTMDGILKLVAHLMYGVILGIVHSIITVKKTTEATPTDTPQN